jgi:hypothetical protein
VPKEVNQTSSVCVANESQVFLCPLFYWVPVQKLQECSMCPVLMGQTRSKMMYDFNDFKKKCSII